MNSCFKKHDARGGARLPPVEDVHDTLIVGAGPAGLACAAFCTGRTLLLERNAQAGKKLLLSGTGRCNISHGGSIRDFPGHYGDHARFVKPALFGFDNRSLIRFFEERGLKMTETEQGKIFPATHRASDVLARLLEACADRNVEFLYEHQAERIEKRGVDFFVGTGDGEVFRARKLVLACGGASYPGTGSDGNGYRLAEGLGHTIVSPRPALAPVVIRDWMLENCAGISIAATRVHLWRAGKKVRSSRTADDLLLTHRGLSGPVILDLSRYIEPGDLLRLSLLPFFPTAGDLERALLESIALHGKRTVRNLLARLGLADRLVLALLAMSAVPPDLPGSALEKARRRTIVHAITEAEFAVEELGRWNEAMVTAGGVRLEEVHPKTLASRLVPHLFFAGELLDVDGDCGGYNLQFAFASGVAAARAGISSRPFEETVTH